MFEWLDSPVTSPNNLPIYTYAQYNEHYYII